MLRDNNTSNKMASVSVSKATSPIHKKQIKLIDTISQKLHKQYKQKVTLEKIR